MNNPEIDQHAITELTLYIENTSEVYHKYTIPVIEKLQALVCFDCYTPFDAIPLFDIVAKEGLKAYNNEFGADLNLTSPELLVVACRLLDGYEELIKDV